MWRRGGGFSATWTKVAGNFIKCIDPLKKMVCLLFLFSLEDVSKSFLTLLRENKNGCVMRLYMEKGCAKIAYVQQEWTEI